MSSGKVKSKEKGECKQSKLGYSELSREVEGLRGRYDRVLEIQNKQESVLEVLVNNIGNLNDRLSSLESKLT
jgi:hypothetical protein